MEAVIVRVPASTSNLGPGFDCLGVALRIYNSVTVTRGRRGRGSEMIDEAADLFFARAKAKPFAFAARSTRDVPVSRGLGSSVTVRLGVMHGLNGLLGRPLPRAAIFELCAQLEGHPDNAAPAEFGGFNVIGAGHRQRVSVDAKLKFVLLVPDFEVSTERAREMLPPKVDRLGAVASCGNACTITAAFASGEYEKLRGAFTDHLHQPFRRPLIPFFDDVVTAAVEAGALGAFISGSGSTVAAVTLRDAENVAERMRAAASGNVRVIITTADNRGARIIIQ
jgi:homoserine kinase